MALTLELSDLEARRIALRAQGFGSPHRPQEVSATVMRRAIGRLGLLQTDSVNVLVRAHYMPLFSRLGLLDGALVARVDLKADRKAGVLMLLRAHLEPAAPADTMERLLGALQSTASWLNLSRVTVPPAAISNNLRRQVQP